MEDGVESMAAARLDPRSALTAFVSAATLAPVSAPPFRIDLGSDQFQLQTWTFIRCTGATSAYSSSAAQPSLAIPTAPRIDSEMTVAPLAGAPPHRPPRRRPVSASSKSDYLLPLPAGSGVSGALSHEIASPRALVSSPPQSPLPLPPPTCSSSLAGTDTSAPFSLKSTLPREQAWTPATKTAVAVTQESGRNRAVSGSDAVKGRKAADPSTRRATDDQLFGPWPGLGDPPLQGEGISVGGAAEAGPAFVTADNPKWSSLREGELSLPHT
jgi:hypothetical protein